MQVIKISLICATVVLYSGCSKISKLISIKEKDRGNAAVNNNVCKTLRGDVVVYAIFVDSKYTQKWTEYDINTTLDSINIAAKWLEGKASENGVPLNINVQYHQKNDVVPIEAVLPKKTLNATLEHVKYHPTGYKKLDKWADGVAKTAGQSLPKDTSKIIKPPASISDRELLVARLRDIHKTDNVALMYFVNNFYKSETSFAIHTNSKVNIEYAVVSYKSPAVVAHELLHLFGATDLYICHYDTNRKLQKKKKLVQKEFPNEIMAYSYRRIETLNISPITKYLIGWDYQLDFKYNKILFKRKEQAARY